MRALVVLSFNLSMPEQITGVLQAIDPPQLPLFAGEARIVVGPEAAAVVHWLDADGSIACPALSPSDRTCIGRAEFHEVHSDGVGTTWRDYAGKRAGVRP